MRRLTSICTLLALVFCACGGESDNYLDGSLTDTYEDGMAFDSVRIRQYQSELSIEYVAEEEGNEKVSLRITLSLSGTTLAAGQEYDLMQHGTISRGAGYEASLPPMGSGTLTLQEYSESQGQTVKGSFNSMFTMSDGSQKSLHGAFSAPLEVVDF